jgi:hypothetical protein
LFPVEVRAKVYILVLSTGFSKTLKIRFYTLPTEKKETNCHSLGIIRVYPTADRNVLELKPLACADLKLDRLQINILFFEDI